MAQSLVLLIKYGGVAELADASDSKSGVRLGRIGSTPITAICLDNSFM